jgi:L-ribulose-5-phosphate 4-epimerase
MLESLREEVCAANLAVCDAGLVTLTWGNVSGYDADAGAMAIKPSGVDYAELTPDKIPIVSVEDGRQLCGDLRPSSDTPTHLVLYRRLADVCGIVHTHSTHATAWAQTRRSLPCYGTTHADHFRGTVPVTRMLTPDETRGEYEHNTGLVIAELYGPGKLDPLQVPAALVAGHGPFAWGASAQSAVENAVVLEEVARMAAITEAASEVPRPLPRRLVDRHFLRKHGRNAYYGQH